MMTWRTDEGVDVTSAFKGITTPVRELYDEIHQRGWTVTKVDIKDGQYVATAQNPHGEKVEKTGNTDATALGNVLLAIMRLETIRFKARTANWSQTWEDQLGEIAHAYAEAPVYDPKAAAAWKELADDMMARAQVVGQQIDVEIVDEPEPYQSIQEMCEDVRKNRHLYVSRANAIHPLWSVDQVVAYRLVRDVLGHCQTGADYGWQGENLATAALMPLLTPTAQKALFTESIGQAAYNSHYRAFGPQKIVFLDEQLGEQEPGGVHPGQSVVPGQIPDVRQKEASTPEKHEVVDPNAGWSSGVTPLPDNAYLWIREESGLDPLDWQGVREAAEKIDTGWHGYTMPDGNPDLDTQKQAVVNALRAVLLSPRKNYRWHATHYQHVAPIGSGVSDPQRYWDTLEGHRDHHNQARGMPAGVHRALFEPEYQAFRQWVKGLYPDLHDGAANEMARRELFHMLAEEEQRIAQDDPDGRLTAMEVEQEAHKNLQRRLRAVTKPSVNKKTDFAENEFRVANVFDHVDPGAYGSYLASHVRSLAAVAHHSNDLLTAARHDVGNNGGRGHHWRKEVARLGIPGVGPKEASFAWLLLQPHTSELAVVSPVVADILGHKNEPTGRRDYYKHERELAAGRDAAGYGHVPLGQFSWGMFDHAQGGHGHHQDLSPIRALHPRPHDQVNWNDLEHQSGKWSKPYWWDATQAARDEVAKQWDEGVALTVPRHEIPWQKVTHRKQGSAPWYTRPDGAVGTGTPGETIMALIKANHPEMTTEQIWQAISEAGKQR